MNLQSNSLAEKNIAKHNNQPTFLPYRRMLFCQELGQEDVPTSSSKVHKIAEVRGGDSGDVGKSHLATKIMGVALARSVARVYVVYEHITTTTKLLPPKS